MDILDFLVSVPVYNIKITFALIYRTGSMKCKKNMNSDWNRAQKLFHSAC